MGELEAAEPVAPQPAPAPQPTPRFSFDEVNKLFAHLRVGLGAQDLKYNDALQFACATHLWRSWACLDDTAREQAWRLFNGKLVRVQQTPSPRECFYQLMQLPREEDIRRALFVRPVDRIGHTYEPGESVYPTQGWLGQYLEYAKYNAVPLAFHFWAGVTALGAACRRNVYVEIGLSRLYMNQYVVLTGEKATGKSVAMEAAVDVLRRLNRHVGEGPEFAPYRVNILPEDITQEGFISKMENINKTSWQQNSTTGVIEARLTDATAILPLDELMNFLGKGNFNIQKRIPFLTTIYAKDDHEKETKGGGPESLRNLAVSMLACSAPAWMREQITQDIFGGGFMDRTLFIHREKTRRCYPFAPPLDPIQAELLGKALVPLTTMPIKQVALLDYEARQWFEQWFRRLHERGLDMPDDPEATSLNRRSNHLLKLATLLAVSYGSFPTVHYAHMEEALSILDVEDTWFVSFLEKVQRKPVSDAYPYIMKTVAKHGGRISKTVLLQKLKWKLGTARQTWDFVDTLLQDGSLVLDSKSTAGKVWVQVPGWQPPA